MEEIAALIVRNQDIVDILDNVLTGPEDRAYVICSATECRNNVKGRCIIHTVTSRGDILPNGRCPDYVM
jgi:hypothetical protein